MSRELASWKARVDDVVRKFDKASCGDKANVTPHINQLHMIVEELEDRISMLKTECQTAWEPEKMELENKLTHLKRTWEEVWHRTSPGDVGG
jgi:predicted nuclease with TOPRIM domain